MFPADRKPTPISVEYDCRNGRSCKSFACAFEARRFYVSKSKAGKHPVVRSTVMAKKTVEKKTTKKKAEKQETQRKPRTIWNERRIAIVKALKALKAVSGPDAQTAEKVAEKAGVETQDVKHFCYKRNELCTQGYTSTASLEGTRLLGYFLTEKGLKLDMKSLGKS